MIYDRQRTAGRAVALAAVPMLAAGLALTGLPSLGQAAKTSTAAGDAAAVATVNGEKITRGQVADELLRQQTTKLTASNPIFQDRNRLVAGVVGSLALKKMAANGGQPVTLSRAEIVDFLFKDNPPVLYQVVQQAIGERVIQQEAKKQGIAATEVEVAAQMKKAIDTARTQYRLQGSDADVLKQIGVSDSYLRPHVRTQLLLEKLVRKDLEAKNNGKAFSDGDYLSASHILVPVQPDPANPAETEKRFEEAKKKIVAIVEDIKTGKTTFEKAAKDNPDATKFKEGSLGTFTRGQMVPEFDKAVFSLPKGQLSEPVRTSFGWHLIRVDRTGSELTGPEKAQILNQSIQQRSNTKVGELMKNAKIVNTLKPPAQPGGMMPG